MKRVLTVHKGGWVGERIETNRKSPTLNNALAYT